MIADTEILKSINLSWNYRAIFVVCYHSEGFRTLRVWNLTSKFTMCNRVG